MPTRRPVLHAADVSSAIPAGIVQAKIRIPAPRPGSIHRTALVNRLRAARGTPLITVIAPGGYGKTTVLAQWAERDARPFAWVSIDERDNKPRVLLRHIAAALERIQPLEPTTLETLRRRDGSVWTTAVPLVTAAVASLEQPSVLVLDDVSRLASTDSLEVLAAIAEHVPEGSTLALSGRTPPRVSLAALRARGRVYEIDGGQLALSRRETELLLRASDVDLSPDHLDELLARTEGWAAGLYLAALSLRAGEGERSDLAAFGGDDRYLADYFRSECLSGMDENQLDFLRRTSVLERMSGPLCDDVLDRGDSALQLEALAEANTFLVPLDRRGEWYRFHQLFRDLLRRELRQHEPRVVATLHGRAATWYAAHSDPGAAVDHALAADDLDGAACLLVPIAHAARDDAGYARIERWLDAFTERLEDFPAVALAGAWVHALRGRPAAAESWLTAAERTPTAKDTTVIALLRAALCRDGVEQMSVEAETALAGLDVNSEWRPTALLLAGTARRLLGASDGDDDHDELTTAGDVADALGALALAVAARTSLRDGRWDDGRSKLASGQKLTPRLSHALPWLAVETFLELTRSHLTLRDRQAATATLDQARKILTRRPQLGILGARAEALEREVAAMTAAAQRNGSSLTAAELRLLPLLATHLSFPEIGKRLVVSRNTVKTQAISIYRKLGVSSRSDAIAEAARLGLLDHVASRPRLVSSGVDDAAA